MTELDGLWAETYRELLNRSAHELKGALNGIALNLEVLRSRIDAGKLEQRALGPFAEAAYREFETATARAEALMALGREHRGQSPPDVAMTLKQLATLLVPAAKAEQVELAVEGYDVSAPTSAAPEAVRLALARGLLALIKEGGGKCMLEAGADAVVRFSHQSASACSLGPVVTSTIAADGIRTTESDGALTLVFPKSR